MKVYSVGQINGYIKNILTQDYLLKQVAVRGEVSNCKYHNMGHIYFSLKDDTGVIPCVMFKSQAASLKFELQNGMSVVVSGSIGVYERDGRYQIYAADIKQEGVGNLFEQFVKLRDRLNEEGLFDPDHKKPLPKIAKRIGIVTAKTGAAIQDIQRVAKRRNPYIELILQPAKVQGEGAAASIAAGIKRLDRMGLDVIIIGRGGGSMEDLWAFNEEIVVRAVYEAKTPIISGTGHEVALTLADYAADQRAATPSQAAEYAVFDLSSVIDRLSTEHRRMRNRMHEIVRFRRAALEALEEKLSLLSPKAKLQKNEQQLADLYDTLKQRMMTKLSEAKHRLELYATRLAGLDPGAKLVRGFGYIEKDGAPVTSLSDVSVGDPISVRIREGTITASVTEVSQIPQNDAE